MTLIETFSGAVETPEPIASPPVPAVEATATDGYILTEELRVKLTKYGEGIVALLKIETSGDQFKSLAIDLPNKPGAKPEQILVPSGLFQVVEGHKVKPKLVSPARDGDSFLLRAEDPGDKLVDLGFYAA